MRKPWPAKRERIRLGAIKEEAPKHKKRKRRKKKKKKRKKRNRCYK